MYENKSEEEMEEGDSLISSHGENPLGFPVDETGMDDRQRVLPKRTGLTSTWLKFDAI